MMFKFSTNVCFAYPFIHSFIIHTLVSSLMQTEPEFRPTMSEVVQSLVKCVQRSSISKRLGGDLSTSRRSDDSDW